MTTHTETVPPAGERATDVPPHGVRGPGWYQSLATGLPGIALWHIEQARTGRADWQPVHQLAAALLRQPLAAHPQQAGLYFGLPPITYTLHTAGHPAYRTVLTRLDHHLAGIVRARLATAHQRLDHGRLPQAREYDLISGLTGLGTLLLLRDRDPALIAQVLHYLTRLTRPLHPRTGGVPGWWATGSPDHHHSARWQHGHAGFGIAHGITGPLTLLAVATVRGHTTPAVPQAITDIVTWLHQWQQHTVDGHPWWPEVIDHTEHTTATTRQTGPGRPSWCYGTPGIAHALHLAGHALHQPDWTRQAEHALAGALTADQIGLLTEDGLCHGLAGLTHAATRIAAASSDAALRSRVDVVVRLLEDRGRGADPGSGFLDVGTGITLALHHSQPAHGAGTGWDACLFIT